MQRLPSKTGPRRFALPCEGRVDGVEFVQTVEFFRREMKTIPDHMATCSGSCGLMAQELKVKSAVSLDVRLRVD